MDVGWVGEDLVQLGHVGNEGLLVRLWGVHVCGDNKTHGQMFEEKKDLLTHKANVIKTE